MNVKQLTLTTSLVTAVLAGCNQKTGSSPQQSIEDSSPAPVATEQGAGTAKTGLACDDSLKTAFKPDKQTTVTQVKLFKAGDVLAFGEPAPSPFPIPKAVNDLCMVKLMVGPGNPGPAGAPSTSPGIGIEVWLPAAAQWNKRIHAMGGGGWQGGVAGVADKIAATYAAAVAIGEGAVSSTTDTGHAGEIVMGGGDPRGDFAMNPDGSVNETLWRDFSVRAIHEQAVKTKALTEAFYGEPAKFAYWEGGSTGGRQGHKLAQAHPDDFDGIIANYPALHWTRLLISMIYPQVVMQRDLGGKRLSKEQLDLVSNAAISACDLVGGQHLGYVMNPAECRYDPTRDQAVLCASDGGANATDACVSKIEANVFNKIWYGMTVDGSVPDPAEDNGWQLAGDQHLWYGLARGTSLWAMYFSRLFGYPAGVANPDGGGSLGSDQLAIELGNPRIAEPGFRNALGNGEGQWRTITYQQLADAYQQALTRSASRYADINTDNPDLTAFKAGGGKLLVWHGTNDEVIPVQGTTRYYDSVVAKMGGLESVQSFYRLYLLPGLGHMSPNGTANPAATPPGFAPGQLYQQLVAWVEQGIEPQDRVDISATTGSVTISQPACAYPARALYRDGDPRVAASYVCDTSATP